MGAVAFLSTFQTILLSFETGLRDVPKRISIPLAPTAKPAIQQRRFSLQNYLQVRELKTQDVSVPCGL